MLYIAIILVIMCLCILSAMDTMLKKIHNNLALKAFVSWLGKCMNNTDIKIMCALVRASPDVGIFSLNIENWLNGKY